MSSHEIFHQSSCAYTLQQNECNNRYLVETARTFLLHHKVPQRFWGDAILAVCYLINCMPSSVLHDKIPHSILFPNQPLFCLPPRVFGCICFVHILTQPKPRSVSSSVIPGFHEVIVATLLIHIDTLSLSMSPFLRTLLCSLSPTLPIMMSYLYPFFIPS